MRRLGLAMVSLALVFAFLVPSAALADQRFTLTISPEWFQDVTGDSSAPPLNHYVADYCPGFAACPGTPRTTNDGNFDYGLAYQFNRKWSVAYTHSAFDFSLGRITIPPVSLLTGDIMDYTNQGTLNYAPGHGWDFDGYYASHQRQNVQATGVNLATGQTGQCFLNGMKCPNGGSNPDSINSNYWGLGAAYSFGPHTAFEPPMFKATVDAQYFPRPANGNCGTPIAQPACGTNGYSPDQYVGSGFQFPYSLTVFPLSPFKAPLGFLPFVAYNRIPAWFHAENTPETFNAIAFGFVQILPHGLSFSYTNFKLNGCYCSDTVPPPDSVRSDTNIYKLTYEYKF